MGFRLGGHLGAGKLLHALERNVDHFDRDVRKIASGEKIYRAADNAAGIAISSNMKSNIKSRNQALRNAVDGISLIQVYEGGLATTSNILIRLRELAVKNASDTMGDTERYFVQKEVDQLKTQIDVVCHNTEFNGIKLLDASAPLIEIQIGAEHKRLHRIVIDTQEMTTSLEKMGLLDFDLSSKVGAQEGIDAVDKAIVLLNNNRARLGALQNRLQAVTNDLSESVLNLNAARSRIMDTDYAKASSDLTMGNIKSQASIMALGSNQERQHAVLKLIK